MRIIERFATKEFEVKVLDTSLHTINQSLLPSGGSPVRSETLIDTYFLWGGYPPGRRTLVEQLGGDWNNYERVGGFRLRQIGNEYVVSLKASYRKNWYFFTQETGASIGEIQLEALASEFNATIKRIRTKRRVSWTKRWNGGGVNLHIEQLVEDKTKKGILSYKDVPSYLEIEASKPVDLRYCCKHFLSNKTVVMGVGDVIRYYLGSGE